MHQIARLRFKQRSLQYSQLAQHGVHLALGAVALGWPHRRDGRIRMPQAVFFSMLPEGKRDHGAPRKRYKGQLKRQLAQARLAISQAAKGHRPSQVALITDNSQL